MNHPCEKGTRQCPNALIRVTSVDTTRSCSQFAEILQRSKRTSPRRLATARRRCRAFSARRNFNRYATFWYSMQPPRLDQNGWTASPPAAEGRATFHQKIALSSVSVRLIEICCAAQTHPTATLTRNRRTLTHHRTDNCAIKSMIFQSRNSCLYCRRKEGPLSA
jgi:hypothetical protein